MMKKKFILFFGVGWAGTTSVWKTLYHQISYLHTGHHKENYYLSLLFNPFYYNLISARIPDIRFFLDYIKIHKDKPAYKPLLNFSREDLLFDPDSKYLDKMSLEHYVNYYIKLSEYCDDNYQAVGDFSNTNYFIDDNDLLKQIKNALESHFDVKCLVIFRDPIRRLFSNTCFTHNSTFKYKITTQSQFLTPDIQFQNTDNVISNIIKNKRDTSVGNYAKKVKQLYEIFGKDQVCYLIMEDFFKENNREEVSKLEKFLDIDIPKVHPCVFVPDKGINAPKVEGLQDQWISDTEILKPEFYNKLRNKKEYSDVYSEFEELHGSLPADWGRPIDYGY